MFPSELRRCLGDWWVDMLELAPGEEGKVSRCLWDCKYPQHLAGYLWPKPSMPSSSHVPSAPIHCVPLLLL